MYPITAKPTWGMFIYEQVESLKTKIGENNIDHYLINGSYSKFEYLKSIFRVRSLCNARDYDIVHVHYGLSLFAVLLIRNKSIFVTLHGSDALLMPISFLTKFLLLKANVILAVSDNIKKIFPSAQVLPCGIFTHKFIPSKSKFVDKAMSIKKYILFPSSPSIKIKNYELYKCVIELLQQRNIDVVEMHLEGVPRTKVPEIFWKADLMLLTSFSEGSPTVIKEAIAAKLPFVSVNVGDVAYWANKINYGFVIDTYNHFLIADKCLEVLNNNLDRNNLNSNGVLNEIDVDSISDTLIGLYSKYSKDQNS